MKKKIMFLVRDGLDAPYLLSKINQLYSIDSVVIESGKIAQRKKVKKYLKPKSIFSFPYSMLSLFSILVYHNIVSFLMKSKIKSKYPPLEYYYCDDVNEKSVIEYIINTKPDLTFIYGVSILKENTLKELGLRLINLHSGLLPKYRNVHSDIWCFLENDTKNLGVTLFYVDSGIDTGDIICKSTVNWNPNSWNIVDAKIKLLNELIKLVHDVLLQSENLNQLTSIPQENEIGTNYQTPGFNELMKFFIYFLFKR